MCQRNIYTLITFNNYDNEDDDDDNDTQKIHTKEDHPTILFPICQKLKVEDKKAAV